MKCLFTRSQKKVIFFDLHDTIIDRESGFIHALQISLEEFTARWDNEVWSPTEAVHIYRREWKKKKLNPKRSRERHQFGCLKEALASSPFEITTAFIRTVLKRTKEIHQQQPRLYPEVKETLQHLNKQYRLAIVSNGNREAILHALQHTGLNAKFNNDNIFTPTSSKLKKPHPDLFRKAMKAMKVQPHQAVMVGNTWSHDIRGGIQCGMDAIWVRHNHSRSFIKRSGSYKIIIIPQFKHLQSIFS